MRRYSSTVSSFLLYRVDLCVQSNEVAEDTPCASWTASVQNAFHRLWASKNDRKGATSQRQSPTGLEPAISRFVGGCLIHWATGTLLIACSTLASHPQLHPFQLQRLTATIPGHTHTSTAVLRHVFSESGITFEAARVRTAEHVPQAKMHYFDMFVR